MVSGNLVLMGFIKTTLLGSHEELMKDFVACLEREVKGVEVEVEVEVEA
jgi:hypothetical protein